MTQPGFPDRTAPAANADVLGEEARNDGRMDGLTDDLGQDGTPRDREPKDPGRERGAAGSGEARPGKDINQAGYVKDAEDKPGT